MLFPLRNVFLLIFLTVVIFGASFLAVHAAPLNFATAESITLSSPPTILVVATGSVADNLGVNATSVLVMLSSTTGGTFTLLSPFRDLSVATSSGGGTVTIFCSDGIKTVTLSQRAGSTVYTVTPSSTNCASASPPTVTSSGGGGVNTGGGSAYNLSINGGTAETATTSVTLSLYGTSAYTMKLSSTSTFVGASWIPYVTTMPWVLAPNLGAQTIYVQFKAISGSVVGSAHASIDLVATGMPASATTPTPATTSLVAQLAALEAQLAALQALATQPISSSTHFLFTRNLRFGITGTDVQQLQQFLISQDAGPAATKLAVHGTTEYFGALTKEAVIEFQTKMDIKPTSGYFGPITRAWIVAHE